MKLIKSLLAAVSACAIGLNSISVLPCTEAAAIKPEGVTENTELYESGGKLTAGTVELTLDELKAANYTVTVPITVSGSGGWCDLNFGVSYSTSDLTCTKVSKGSAIEDSGYTVYPGVGINKDKGIVWCGYSVAQNSSMIGFVTDGEAAALTFSVASDASPGDSYQIKLLAENNGIQQEIVTADGTDSCFLADGSIIIEGTTTTTTK
ncbi:MAG: cohesin domain-containing protein, partial [Ruminococcus sp.]